ncbi:protein FAR1-RELATED SEQUENCE 5-like [Macadamia integrifolia]|uniref:protein FAR1-RELATED SEQUENCE 5-like n=1 Tax=Macadamia integrifolia TaxID=60698 RepID=UPI001C52EDF0|nr:protein FAR1-RELATED SEQUENCE 5-like [Macadamia integrifolia]
MAIYLMENGKYECRAFMEEHNYPLHISGTTHFMHFQRKILEIHSYEIDLADDSRINPKAAFELIGSLLKYFENQSMNNPLFTYSMQLDSDEQITNIFWADPKMRIDYAQFGDVVSFDTTFCTNKEYRSFGIFDGFNHHRGLIIFGAALLYDETVESFSWLFEAFAEANG